MSRTRPSVSNSIDPTETGGALLARVRNAFVAFVPAQPAYPSLVKLERAKQQSTASRRLISLKPLGIFMRSL
jgi:hypothetical protein